MYPSAPVPTICPTVIQAQGEYERTIGRLAHTAAVVAVQLTLVHVISANLADGERSAAPKLRPRAVTDVAWLRGELYISTSVSTGESNVNALRPVLTMLAIVTHISVDIVRSAMLEDSRETSQLSNVSALHDTVLHLAVPILAFVGAQMALERDGARGHHLVPRQRVPGTRTLR